MRIAHLVAHPGLNGVATACHALINAQQDAGHDVLLVAMTDAWLPKQPFRRMPHIIVSDMPTRPDEIRRVGYAIRDWRPDAIHCHGSRANKYGMIYRIAAGSPVVTTAHARKIQLPWMFFRAIIAPSRQTADFHRRFNLVARRKLHVVSNIVDIDRVRPVSQETRTRIRGEFGFDDETFVIAVVGHICARKNQIDALRIVNHLAARGHPVRLLLVGGTEGQGEMTGWNELLADPVVRRNTILTGHRDDALDIMDGIDTLLSVSKIEEGSIVILEALAKEIPVVGYRTGQTADLLTDGDDALTTDIGDVGATVERLERLIADRTLAHGIGAEGRKTLERECSPQAVVAALDRIYADIAAEAGG
ncbi:MAG: glycosyltransferase family 4 protein [Rhizobiaceae bacterium]